MSGLKYVTPFAQAMQTPGLREMVICGIISVLSGGAILGLAIPTICLLPYTQYAALHTFNVFAPLLISFTGLKFWTSAIKTGPFVRLDKLADAPVHAMRQALYLAGWTLFFLLHGFGFIIYDNDGGLVGHVIQQIRTNRWGDLNPTKSQITALEILYVFINFIYAINGLIILFNAVFAAVYWVRLAFVPIFEEGKKEDDDMEEKVKMSGDGEKGEKEDAARSPTKPQMSNGGRCAAAYHVCTHA